MQRSKRRTAICGGVTAVKGKWYAESDGGRTPSPGYFVSIHSKGFRNADFVRAIIYLTNQRD